MLINEVCKCCNLTKKAIDYYETKGLVQPAILENGYRDYSENEVATLKEISVLRRFGIGISEIKAILNSGDKSIALKKCRYVTEVRMKRLMEFQKCMDNLIQDYDIDREFELLSHHREDVHTIKERLAFAFPGNYGLFISLHFGRFLNEAIDTEEKQNAYNAILKFLDNVDVYLDPELCDALEETTAFQGKIDIAELQSGINDSIMEALSDTETYLDQNQNEIEQYLAFKATDEFKQSPAGQLQRSMLEFQKSSGYQEIFIANMKVLSKSYSEYLQQLAAADQKFIQRFPSLKYM